jgi:hypothetical protein
MRGQCRSATRGSCFFLPDRFVLLLPFPAAAAAPATSCCAVLLTQTCSDK